MKEGRKEGREGVIKNGRLKWDARNFKLPCMRINTPWVT